MTDNAPDLTETDLADIPDYLDQAEAVVPPIQAPRDGVLRFARMTGSSICARDAAPWVTDFLNAAYYRRPAGERDVDDCAARLRSSPPTGIAARSAAGCTPQI
jgi:hypothetical protein